MWMPLAAQPVDRSRPPVLYYGPEELARLTDNASRGEEPFQSAWKKLQESAKKAMTGEFPPFTGTDSVNLGSETHAITGAIRDLALVHHVTKDEKYLDRARSLFLSWSQHSPMIGTTVVSELFKKQEHDGSGLEGLGLNMGHTANEWASCYALLWPHLSETARQTTEKWLLFMADQILVGHLAWTENDYLGKQNFNNHLSGHNLGFAAVGFATRTQKWVDFAIDSPRNPADWKEMHNGAIIVEGVPYEKQLWQEDPTLTQDKPVPAPGEIYDRYRILTVRGGRGCGWPYAMFHQKMLTELAEMAWNNGIDLYSYVGPDGENLRQTYRYYAPFFVYKSTDIQSGYYANNMLHLSNIHMYEIARLRLPQTHEIDWALRHADRVAMDHALFGYSAVLSHGTPLTD